MKLNFKYSICFLFFALFMNACSKDTAKYEVDLSYQMLADKTWYLDYQQTITGTSIKQQTYVGQSTYFVNFLKDHTTSDSDGLTGSYQIQKSNGVLSIQVNAIITSTKTQTYTYNIESIGAKNLVISYQIGTQTVKRYFKNR